jgi:hypothetical protein
MVRAGTRNAHIRAGNAHSKIVIRAETGALPDVVRLFLAGVVLCFVGIAKLFVGRTGGTSPCERQLEPQSRSLVIVGAA